MIQNLLHYARLCEEVYQDHPEGLALENSFARVFNDQGGRACAIRGSDDKVDWRENFRMFRAAWEIADGETIMAHRGFVSCAERLLPEVQGKGIKVWTGHSRGGAVALLLALRLGGAVVQFGAPKACSAADAARLGFAHVRVENGADMVPRRPNLPWYGHGGTLFYLQNGRGGGHSVDPGWLCRFADRLLDPIGRGTDHLMRSYVRRLELLSTDPSTTMRIDNAQA